MSDQKIPIEEMTHEQLVAACNARTAKARARLASEKRAGAWWGIAGMLLLPGIAGILLLHGYAAGDQEDIRLGSMFTLVFFGPLGILSLVWVLPAVLRVFREADRIEKGGQ